MNKKLVNNNQELIDYLLEDLDFQLHEVESLLGIEFPFEDGSYQSSIFDGEDGEDIDESQDVDTSNFRVVESDYSEGLPEDFPVIVVIEKFGSGRGDDFNHLAVEYIYQSDFVY